MTCTCSSLRPILTQVWEKAGVNVSVVYGEMPPEAYRAATGDASKVRSFLCRTHG